MSGPKVVRIKTREEYAAEAMAQLRTVDVALRQLERSARRHDAWSDELSRRLAGRRDVLQRCFDGQEWRSLEQAATAELAFLEAEAARIEDDAITQVEKGVLRRQRLRATAQGLIRQLQQRGRAVPTELMTMEREAVCARDSDLAGFESLVNRQLRALIEPESRALGAGARGLAERLRSDEPTVRLADVGASEQPASLPARDARVARLIAELSTIAPESVPPFLARLGAAGSEVEPSHRALLMESLVLDVAGEVRRLREWRVLVSRVEEMSAALMAERDVQCDTLRRNLERALEVRVVAGLEASLTEAAGLLEARARQRAAAARRSAVLTALAALGYEVREGMETALASSGRVIVRKASVSDYGVEVAAVADAGRFQVRVVGSASMPRTAARDRDAETVWCGEVDRLREALRSSGTELAIERATGVGATPVKSVDMGMSDDADVRARNTGNARRLSSD